MKVAILVPVCSRNQPWKTFEDCYWAHHAWPALQKTFSSEHTYTIYIGIDDDDEFFLNHKDRFEAKTVVLEGCKHAPAWAWNKLFEVAIQDGNDYFFQMADDVVLEVPGWTDTFIQRLQENGNLGAVGPCNLDNYNGRLQCGQRPVLENAFVHRRHYEIFGYFYPPEIKNWYCDDWITHVYKNHLSDIMIHVPVRNLSIYQPDQQRYVIEKLNWKRIVDETEPKIRSKLRGCFSFCLYGPYCDKYYKGMLENIALIQEYYPSWDIIVYGSEQAISYLQERTRGIEVFTTPADNVTNTLYRFLPVLSDKYDVVFIRDADSRVHVRDRWCIETFLDSPFRAFTIRDHPWHRYRMMAGLWGCKRLHGISMEDIQIFIDQPMGYTTDAIFLETKVYPLVKKDMVVFCYSGDGLFGDPEEHVKVIEQPIENKEFCGNVIEYNPDPYYVFDVTYT